MPGGKGRHSAIAVQDQGRAIAALLKNPEDCLGASIDLFGPVEMDYEQMAAELSNALGRKIVYQDLPIDEYTASPAQMGLPPDVVEHFGSAMLDYQHGHMAGADDNVEKLTASRSMTVGGFARLQANLFNAN